MTRSNRNRYVVEALVHASHVLNAFQSKDEVLRLKAIVERTGLTKSMCFRLLYTLHSCGFLDKVGRNQYRLISDLRPNRRYRIGYASQGRKTSFSHEVECSLARAAESANVELVMVDDRLDAKTALRNADHLIREEIDLVIDFQPDEAMAPAVAQKYLEADIPVIAIDAPHPGSTYFGANNYEAGLMGGRHLGRWPLKHWQGQIDEILMIETPRGGQAAQSRIRGMLAGIDEVLRRNGQVRVVHLEGDGQFKQALECVRKYLRVSSAKHTLVGAATDPSALGALRAFEELGRGAECAVVGHSAEPEVRAELRERRTRLIGSVAYFPEKYGPALIRLALDILAHKHTPPAVFIKHQLITPETVDHFYPNDKLMGFSRTRPEPHESAKPRCPGNPPSEVTA